MTGLIFKKGLSGNALKIIALIAMTFDHVGAIMYPWSDVLRIIGRISLPIFSFFIAEGCAHTRNKKRYFLTVFTVGLLCAFGYYVVGRIVYLNILIVFSFSIAMIFSLEFAVSRKSAVYYILPVFFITASYIVNGVLPYVSDSVIFEADYGFLGSVLPVLVYLVKDFRLKLVALTFGLTVLALNDGDVQWWAYLSVLILLFYDGRRGKYKLKYLFYVYYPLHLVVIYCLNMII